MGQKMNAYTKVYQALDTALASGERAVAPGTEAAVQSAIAELRARGGPREAVAKLQEISVDLARLNGALRGGDEEECLVQRARLAQIKDSWLREAPLH
jgi:hypothetical protein